MAKVELDQIVKRYRDRTGRDQVVVKGVSLSVADGEFMVLVGPSGCGKSTTLRMIAGLEEISSGTISIDGRIINDVPPRDRDIAMVFQNYALYPHMSVYDNLAFGLRMRDVPKAEIDKRVREAAALLGLAETLERRPSALSGGQRQRVAVGRAIVRQPKVFLFDEPLSNLDAKMRVSMRAELSALHQKLGATMIYVTHDQVEAMTLGDRICVMNGGEVQQVARPMDLYAWPENAFTASFIGSPPMNFLKARVETVGDGLGARTATGQLLTLPANRQFRTGVVAGLEVLLGFRPEDADAHAEGLQATAVLTEHMGAEALVHATVGTERCILRMPPGRAPKSGDPLRFLPRPDCIRIFDTSTGSALLAPSSA
ncbi:ABC transporter ATP-binding protein [Nibricoccus sp. IMCC34717]|uniref:ABC transporter ATP-binding protein n=1 Tax=Nibricoccus sp. IMCC34717 TaxID=3034021 RepID=UPI00384A5C12